MLDKHAHNFRVNAVAESFFQLFKRERKRSPVRDETQRQG